MNNYKHFLCVILWMFMPQMCIAIDLELSDIIKEAREAQMKIAKSQIKQNVEQTKNQYKAKQNVQGEQSAAEKLNPDEILKTQKESNSGD